MVEASTPTIGREEKGEGAGLGGKYARFGSSVPIIYNSQSVTLGLLCINELTSYVLQESLFESGEWRLRDRERESETKRRGRNERQKRERERCDTGIA